MMLKWCSVFCTLEVKILVKFSFRFCLFICLIVSSTLLVNKDECTVCPRKNAPKYNAVVLKILGKHQ